jgi:signal peptidase I
MRGQRYHGVRIAFLPLVALGVTVWWRRNRPFRVAVDGESMAPTLMPGEFLVAVARGDPKRGSLVLVEHPARVGLEMVKRVTGLPGDSVGERLLGPDQYWIEGENREGSTDSRQLGPVPRMAIRGIVRIRYWPPTRIGLL